MDARGGSLASMRSQIIARRGSPCFCSNFLQRPIAVDREDGKPIDPKSLAVTIAERFKGCTRLNSRIEILESARGAVLQLDWKRAGEKSAMRQLCWVMPEEMRTDAVFAEGRGVGAIARSYRGKFANRQAAALVAGLTSAYCGPQ
jgi:hypothetical protein